MYLDGFLASLEDFRVSKAGIPVAAFVDLKSLEMVQAMGSRAPSCNEAMK